MIKKNVLKCSRVILVNVYTKFILVYCGLCTENQANIPISNFSKILINEATYVH